MSMPVQPTDCEITMRRLIALTQPCRNAEPRTIMKPISPIPVPKPIMNFPVLTRFLDINQPPAITEIPPSPAIRFSMWRIIVSRSAVAPSRCAIRYSITLPRMPVEPVAPATKRSIPPRYAKITATLRDTIPNSFPKETIKPFQ